MNIVHIQFVERCKNGKETLAKCIIEIKGKIVCHIDPVREVVEESAFVVDIFAVESPKVFKQLEKVHEISAWQVVKGERAKS